MSPVWIENFPARRVEWGGRVVHLDARAGLLELFADRALDRGLVVFHEPGGQGPEPVARLDRAPAQKNLVLPLRDAADHDLGVLVMNRAAGRADVPRQGVPRGGAPPPPARPR